MCIERASTAAVLHTGCCVAGGTQIHRIIPCRTGTPRHLALTFTKWCTSVSSGSGAKLTRRRSFFEGFLRCCLRREPSRPPSGPRFFTSCAIRGHGRGWSWDVGSQTPGRATSNRTLNRRRPSVPASTHRAAGAVGVMRLLILVLSPAGEAGRPHGCVPRSESAGSCRCGAKNARPSAGSHVAAGRCVGGTRCHGRMNGERVARADRAQQNAHETIPCGSGALKSEHRRPFCVL
mgnify:CR=1 FL=1